MARWTCILPIGPPAPHKPGAPPVLNWLVWGIAVRLRDVCAGAATYNPAMVVDSPDITMTLRAGTAQSAMICHNPKLGQMRAGFPPGGLGRFPAIHISSTNSTGKLIHLCTSIDLDAKLFGEAAFSRLANVAGTMGEQQPAGGVQRQSIRR